MDQGVNPDAVAGVPAAAPWVRERCTHPTARSDPVTQQPVTPDPVSPPVPSSPDEPAQDPHAHDARAEVQRRYRVLHPQHRMIEDEAPAFFRHRGMRAGMHF